MDEAGKLIKEQLLEAIKELDKARFCDLLREASVDIWDIRDANGLSIYHALPMCLTREERLVEYFELSLEVLKYKYADRLKEAVKRTLDLKAKDSGKSALHLATQNNKRILVRKYVLMGADLRCKDNEGCSVVHTAAIYGHCALLVIYNKEMSLSIEERDNSGRTPLHRATLECASQSADLLISWMANLDLQDNEGQTPLHIAAFVAQPQCYRIARHLLMRGASRTAKDKNGQSPLDIARTRLSPEITELLVKQT
mmetsp:Transcript_32121/g.55455  ORF Transcript_32121/g.55455 Transcript_32121/m.55455 type:complete len:255 (-) Transcript_32121:4004-4768(-)